MVFSLFRKKTVDELAGQQVRRVDPKAIAPASPSVQPEAVETAEPAAEVADLVPLEFDLSEEHVDGSIEVVDRSESVDPVVEQVAMFYASNQLAEGAALLEDVLHQEHAARMEVWLMLFDLYGLLGRRQAHEDLALKFVEQFKRSAPDWVASNGERKAVAKPEAAVGTSYFAFSGVLTAETVPQQLEQYQKVDAKGQPVRVEFAKIQGLEPAGAQLLYEWLHAKTRSKRVWLNLPTFSARLDGAYEVLRRQDEDLPFWLLKLDVLQMLGDQESFENLAVDYAVTYEVSPPSWDKSKVVSDVVATPEAEHEPVVAPLFGKKEDEDVFFLQGSVVEGNDDALNALRAYAESRRHLHIDMHKTTRLDFSSAGWMLNMFIEFQTAGKSITILGPNELTIGLFRVLGITDLATVVRRK